MAKKIIYPIDKPSIEGDIMFAGAYRSGKMAAFKAHRLFINKNSDRFVVIDEVTQIDKITLEYIKKIYRLKK